MASVVQKEIGGRTFQFGKMAPADAVPVGWKLLPVIPGLLKAVARMKQSAGEQPAPGASAPTPEELGKLLDQVMEDAQVQTLIEAVTSKIDGKDLFEMMRTTFKSVTVSVAGGAAPLDIDVFFADGLSMDMLKVFMEALRVNFAGFLAGARSPSSLAAPVT